ncbi:MAG: amidase family protein [Gammaproteobacteria bacterium]|nr:amidase family protein [Gammaproteobacteria bacterium]MDH5802894.1 amidase family protein [Gammaproteobacteria bacterium]
MFHKFSQWLLIVLVAVAISACARVPLRHADTYTPPRPSASDEPFTLVEATIGDVHRAFRNGKLSCLELVREYLNRIKQYDSVSKLNAITFVNKRAVETALKLDGEFRRSGKLRSMHCVPLIVKDNFLTKDLPTTAGSQVLRSFIPDNDAFMVAALKQAGALVLAKSNMAEWAFSPYFTISSTAGETRNPYDLNRVPAGSSGGTAAAISANLGLVGLGTDTGNSIRGPASHTALVGIRSTLGSTSRSGVIPLLMNRDVAGPLTRTVEDAARVFAVIDAYDPEDPITKKGRDKLPVDYTQSLSRSGLKGMRIGVLRTLVQPGDEDFEITEIFERALRDLHKAGAVIVDAVDIPNFAELRKINGFCSRFRYDINRFFKSMGDKVPVQSLAQIVESGAFHETSKRAMDWAMSVDVAPEEQEIPCVDVEGDPRRKSYRDTVQWAMDKQQLDALVYPTWTNPPRLLGDLDSPNGNNSPVIAPHTGQPAITVPMGFTQSGLPTGIQFLGREFSEALLFQLAYAYEQATLHRQPPAMFP